MSFLDTKYKRKSAIITSVIMMILILLLFIFGLGYKDPPDEYGVEINFGYTDAGSGDNTTSTEDVKTAPTKPTEPQPEITPPVETPPEPIKAVETPVEEVITQDTEDAPEVNTEPTTEPVKDIVEPVKDPIEPVTETTEPVKDPIENVATPTPAPPKPDQSTTDAMDALLNGPKNDGTSNSGDGDSTTPGNQGDVNGNPYANSYYGGGSGNGTGYGLNGRKKLGVDKFPQDCNEEGKVVVKIFVARTGKVMRTTIQQSDDPCLNAAAKKTAMSYKFSAAPNAPATQTGFVIVNFSLGQ